MKTQISFGHVSDPQTKKLLTENKVPSQKQLTEMVDVASQCLADDQNNEDIPYEIISKREEAVNLALDNLESGDLQACFEQLKVFWSV